ncbi:MAG: PIN domain nuclease [Actinomycetota bacterium]|nr:PIN domain nuclease [Actinomycetota bacterium]
MILADTSAWIEFDRATGSSVDLRITDLVSNSGPLVVTEPVMMEIIAGARSEQHEYDLRRLLLRFDLLGFDAAIDFDGAARLYRKCRLSGITPRGMVDCMIASVASRYEASLLTFDADLIRIARVAQIDLDDASTSK